MAIAARLEGITPRLDAVEIPRAWATALAFNTGRAGLAQEEYALTIRSAPCFDTLPLLTRLQKRAVLIETTGGLASARNAAIRLTRAIAVLGALHTGVLHAKRLQKRGALGVCLTSGRSIDA